MLEAYALIKSNNCLSSLYEFTEEIPFPFGVFTLEGKEKLLDAVKRIRNSDTCFALYTCEPYSFLLGSLLDSVFILNTHAVPSACGGRSTGILMCFSGSMECSIKSASKWLWKRLLSSGVKGDTPQSLCVIKKERENSSNNGQASNQTGSETTMMTDDNIRYHVNTKNNKRDLNSVLDDEAGSSKVASEGRNNGESSNQAEPKIPVVILDSSSDDDNLYRQLDAIDDNWHTMNFIVDDEPAVFSKASSERKDNDELGNQAGFKTTMVCMIC